MRMGRSLALLTTMGVLLAVPLPLRAQAVGTFTWQLQPFCNRVTVTITQEGGVYTLDGFDDQCGAPQRAPLVGLATANPDGSIGFGLHVVTVPGGRGLEVEARINLATLGGPWTDSAGNSGTFAFGAATGGSPRPPPTIPAGAIALGSITAAHLAPGVVGAVAQARVTGVCGYRQALRGVNADGSVYCSNASTEFLPVNGGTGSSIAIGADGFPVISHIDGLLQALSVTHCANAGCTIGATATVDAPSTGLGQYSSIAIGTDGLPIISYRGFGAQALRVTHCGNAGCTAGNTTLNVDNPADAVGLYSSIAIGTDGLPIISHRNDTTGALRVTHCGNVACTAGNTSMDVDGPPAWSVGLFTSIAIGSDGLPVISHKNLTQALRVTHCGNVTCTAGNSSVDVDDPADAVGDNSSLAIGTDGMPIISHRNQSKAALRVTHCGNVTCTSGSSSSDVDDPADQVGQYSSIAIGADGLPVISHKNISRHALRVTHCADGTCSGAGVSFDLDLGEQDDGGSFSSIATGTDGFPVISSYKFGSTGGRLRVVKCGTPQCQ